MISAEQTPAIGEMVVIHRGFRRSLAAAPGLVRDLRPGDHARIRLVTEHLRDLLNGLHIHHVGEDELLWPLILERAPEDAARIQLMTDQHHRVDELIEQLTALLPSLAANPAAYRDQTATTLANLAADLETHMTAEEELLLPLVARHITVAEWEHLGAHGLAQVPSNRRLLTLSKILDVATPEERPMFLKKVPAPVRLLWKFVGRRQLARAEAQLYGRAA